MCVKADEKRCPRCAEAIKKAALQCKHCGYQFTPEEIAAQNKLDVQANKAAGIGCLVVVGLIALVATCSSLTSGGNKPDSADGSAEAPNDEKPSELEMMSRFQVAAKDAMTNSLKDPGSAKYRDVTGHKVEASGAYVFCGQVNSKNGFGGYTGFQRFVAGPGIAVTEDVVDDFHTVWNEFCTKPGETVWF